MNIKDPFEPVEVAEEVFLDVLSEAVAVLEQHGVPTLVVGGIASATLGRDRWTHDIDLFVRTEDARRGLAALAEAGFRTQETYPDWLFKGIKHGVLVDLIFCASEEVFLDEEMLTRALTRSFHGRRLRVVPPEDLLVIKVLAYKERTPRHWFDALGLVAARDLDWPYLLRRAAGRERRVLSLLVYAQADGLPVPDAVIRALIDRIYQEIAAAHPSGPNGTKEPGTVGASAPVEGGDSE